MAKKQTHDFDLIVIGSGAGGSIAALIAAKSGKRVAMVEADTFGGECPNWGCVPAKALLHAASVYDSAKHSSPFGLRSAAIGYNYPSLKAWKDLAVRRTGASKLEAHYTAQGVTVLKGLAHFIGPHEITVNRQHLTATHFVVATGGSLAIPPIEGLKQAGYITAREAVDLIRPPKSLFVIGGGAIGCEFAQLFSTFGSKVLIADLAPRLLPKEDTEASSLIEELFTTTRGMEILGSTKVIKVTKEGALKRVTYQRGGETLSVKVEEVLVAAGKTPNTDIGLENAGVTYTSTGITVDDELRTSAKHIYAAGDVIGMHHQAHTAIYQGRIAAHNILNRDKTTADYTAVPRVTYLLPELASVGLSEEECLKRDLPIRKSIAPLNLISRSNIANTRDGFVKIIALKDGTILGATIMSPSAGEMIQELTLAIQYGIKAHQVANTLHAFPSWSEAIRVACSRI